MTPTNSLLIVIAGPTGSGKSHLARSLARRLHAEIVNFDSVQLYRSLNIGSAKTPEHERGGIPHHLIDVANPEEDLTAGAYSRLARATLTELAARHIQPILVGGTGFYLRSLLDGLSPAPSRNAGLRNRLNELRQPAALHRFLRRRDPVAAARIHPNDHQKLIRAIELTTSPAPPPPREPLLGFRAVKLALDPPRAELYWRLNERSAQMFRSGLLEETADLLKAGVPPQAKALQSLGYRQAVAVLENRMTRAEAVLDLQTKTRQYAKRQLTWFRSEPEIRWLSGFGDQPEIEQAALDEICR